MQHPEEKLTHLVFTLLVFDPLEDVVDDAAPGGVVEKSVFVVDDETAVKRAGYYKSVCREAAGGIISGRRTKKEMECEMC